VRLGHRRSGPCDDQPSVSEVANQLQVVSEEATQLHESNTKLSEDLEGESARPFLSPFLLFACLVLILTCLLVL
jgi:hypothetical protein